MTEETITDLECGNCGRTVTEINLYSETGTCLFCDINEDGREDSE